MTSCKFREGDFVTSIFGGILYKVIKYNESKKTIALYNDRLFLNREIAYDTRHFKLATENEIANELIERFKNG